MKTFEYLQEVWVWTNPREVDRFNQLGAEGWEIVHMVSAPGTNYARVFMKRERSAR